MFIFMRGDVNVDIYGFFFGFSHEERLITSYGINIRNSIYVPLYYSFIEYEFIAFELSSRIL